MMSSLSVAVVLCIRCFPSCSPSPCFFFVSSFLFPWAGDIFPLDDYYDPPSQHLALTPEPLTRPLFPVPSEPHLALPLLEFSRLDRFLSFNVLHAL